MMKKDKTAKLFDETDVFVAGEKRVEKIGFFDIDGTIFRSSLLIELINELVDRKIFPKRAGEEIKTKKIAWLDRVGRYDDYLSKVVEIHLKYIKGCRWEDIRKTVDDVIYFEKDRVYRFTRDLIKQLKRDGYFLVAISGSPVYLVEEFAKHMGFDRAFGQIIGIKDGLFTGEIVNKNFRDKESVIAEFIEKDGIEPDFTRSLAVGDTDNDIAMLKKVGKPIAFNPNKELAKHAKDNGWDIVVERKDVIYKIKDFDLVPYSNES